jgi:hypothetical protein
VENGRVSVTPLPDRAVDEQFISRLRPLMVDIETELAASAG